MKRHPLLVELDLRQREKWRLSKGWFVVCLWTNCRSVWDFSFCAWKGINLMYRAAGNSQTSSAGCRKLHFCNALCCCCSLTVQRQVELPRWCSPKRAPCSVLCTFAFHPPHMQGHTQRVLTAMVLLWHVCRNGNVWVQLESRWLLCGYLLCSFLPREVKHFYWNISFPR